MSEAGWLGDEEPTLARASGVGGEPRFAPGALLAGRYRVVYPLGRGGTGEGTPRTGLGHAEKGLARTTSMWYSVSSLSKRW